ncbi:MAG: LysR family transcriptional regulator [bacterium]
MDWRSINFDWNRTRAFLVAAEEASFSAAARALNISQPTISRQILQLEEELGVMLFERIGTQIELTAAGVELLESARAMGEAATRLSLAASGQSASVEGTVSVTASEAISAYLLPRAVQVVRERYPKIELELVVANDARDLHRREADIAVRNFESKQPDLIARKLRTTTAGMYATPAYLARHPLNTVAEIRNVELFAFDRSSLMIDGLRALGLDVDRGQFPVATQSHLVQWSMCKQGLGVCLMMREVGDIDPDVVAVLPEVAIPIPIWLVSHRELRTSRRIRVVYDALAEVLSVPLDHLADTQ